MVDYLPKWHRIDELVDLVQFVGVQRPRYKAGTSYPVIWVDVPLMDISSSMVRDFLAQGRTPNFLLPKPVLDYIEKEGLTERHARALLKVDDPEVMWTVLRAVTDRHLNVEQTETMIAHLLGEDAPADKHRRKVVPLFRDVRIFVNTVNKAIATMQASGIDAVSNKTETDDYIEFHVRIPKHTDESTTQSSANADKPA